ncbi:hypothetical protein HPB52_017486 [Rhipicephalus sanguineus]|uniref:Uncharacterized protein n=1 Tax=Rhipicephalus sanguineus TaxID=34632 RepID=A0A9D4PHF9_RHISA|nr:hypothetical protein HPB52_017486 [Rhipicephalus sanguineus]
MADDQEKRTFAKAAPSAASDDSTSTDSEDDNQEGLPRWRRVLQLRHLELSSCSNPDLPTSVTSTPTKEATSSTSKPSASSSPAKRAVGAVAGAVSTAFRNAVTSQCCAMSSGAVSPEEASPVQDPTPEEQLRKSPDKSCIRVRTPSPDAILPKTKVSFTGVSERSVDNDDGSSTCEREPYQQRRPRDTPPSSTQPNQETPQASVQPA